MKITINFLPSLLLSIILISHISFGAMKTGDDEKRQCIPSGSKDYRPGKSLVSGKKERRPSLLQAFIQSLYKDHTLREKFLTDDPELAQYIDTTCSDFSPLHHAMSVKVVKRRELVELLIKHKADVDARSKYGSTPLHYAAKNGHKDVVEFLLKNTAVKVNDQDEDFGNTALHIAVKEGQTEIAEYLLSHHAQITLKNKEGKTALELAQEKDKTPFTKLFEAHSKAQPSLTSAPSSSPAGSSSSSSTSLTSSSLSSSLSQSTSSSTTSSQPSSITITVSPTFNVSPTITVSPTLQTSSGPFILPDNDGLYNF